MDADPLEHRAFGFKGTVDDIEGIVVSGVSRIMLTTPQRVIRGRRSILDRNPRHRIGREDLVVHSSSSYHSGSSSRSPVRAGRSYAASTIWMRNVSGKISDLFGS